MFIYNVYILFNLGSGVLQLVSEQVGPSDQCCLVLLFPGMRHVCKNTVGTCYCLNFVGRSEMIPVGEKLVFLRNAAVLWLNVLRSYSLVKMVYTPS